MRPDGVETMQKTADAVLKRQVALRVFGWRGCRVVVITVPEGCALISKANAAQRAKRAKAGGPASPDRAPLIGRRGLFVEVFSVGVCLAVAVRLVMLQLFGEKDDSLADVRVRKRVPKRVRYGKKVDGDAPAQQRDEGGTAAGGELACHPGRHGSNGGPVSPYLV